jgi:hypothetical protein
VSLAFGLWSLAFIARPRTEIQRPKTKGPRPNLKENNHWRKPMPKYVIERVVPGASNMTPTELKNLSLRSCNVLNEMGPQIQWVHSYVTDNKIYCVYIAPNEELVREHARLGGFPANHVAQVKTVIDPTTSED